MALDLGPEGYCKFCNRMVATVQRYQRLQVAPDDSLTETAGRAYLIWHQTGVGREATTCRGSYRAPQKKVPRESRNHSFSYEPKRVKP